MGRLDLLREDHSGHWGYLSIMDEKTHRQARAILEAIKRAYGDLYGRGPAKQRVGQARMHFSGYLHHGPLSSHVRDVYHARGVQAMEAALDTLERLARASAEEEE